MAKRIVKAILAVVGMGAFVIMLGAVGGIEHGTMGLLPGALWALASLTVAGLCAEAEVML